MASQQPDARESRPTMFERGILYNLYTLWLFNYSDLKLIVGPSTLFAVLHVLAEHNLTYNLERLFLLWVVISIPRTAFWTWMNLLPFTIGNQRQPGSSEEDALNKPFRPLPSGRITAQEATTIMLTLIPLVVAMSAYVGAPIQSITLVLLNIYYNDFGGSDGSLLIRNLINAVGHLCCTTGAFEVMRRQPLNSSPIPLTWYLLIGCVIFTTVQIQDLHDQLGDSKRGRRTTPLILGDAQARLTVALPVLFWSLFCPYFWRLSPPGYGLSMMLALSIVYRLHNFRSARDDKRTFKLWNLWMVSLYTLPLFHAGMRPAA